MGRVKRNIQEVDSKYDSLEPKYMEVLLDLSTKCKSAYLEHSSRSDDSSISRLITDKNNNDIPDNIHTIFLNYTIVLNMIQKEMKYVLTNFQKLMDDIQDKTVMVSGFMDSLNLGDFIEEPGLDQGVLGDPWLVKVDWLMSSRANPSRPWNWYSQSEKGPNFCKEANESVIIILQIEIIFLQVSVDSLNYQ